VPVDVRQFLANRTRIIAGAALMVVVATIVYFAAVRERRSEVPAAAVAVTPANRTEPAPQASAPAVQETPSPSTDVPALPPVPVTVDIRPWARVRIVAAEGVQVPAEPMYTPFTIQLAPGDYSLECDNGGVTKPVTYTLKVAATGKPHFFTRTMPGFNSTKVVDALLAREP